MAKPYGGMYIATVCGKIAQHFSPPTKICFLCLCANCQTKGEAAANRN